MDREDLDWQGGFWSTLPLRLSVQFNNSIRFVRCAGRIQTTVQSEYVTFNGRKLILTWSKANTVRSLIWPSVGPTPHHCGKQDDSNPLWRHANHSTLGQKYDPTDSGGEGEGRHGCSNLRSKTDIVEPVVVYCGEPRKQILWDLLWFTAVSPENRYCETCCGLLRWAQKTLEL